MGIENILIVTAAIGAISSCGSDERITLDDPGPRAEIERSVDDFEAIEVSGPIRVVVTDGAQSALAISGPQNVLDHLVTNTSAGVLEIGIDRDVRTGWKWNEDNAITITLSHGNLTGAAIAGSGGIEIERSVVERFEGEIAGSGDLVVKSLKASAADFAIAGSGDVRAAGEADTLEVSIAGSGDFDGASLQSDTAEVEIAGSGEVAAHARETASVSIAGSGDVNITGGAKCTVSKNGSGDVTCG